MDNTPLTPANIWTGVFEQVRRVVKAPMVWLAMQAAVPLALDGNYFVVGLAPDKQYMANNLQTFENVSAIEDALHALTGRILAFRLIEGDTLADWESVRAMEASIAAAVSPAPAATLPAPHPPRDVSRTWDDLGDRIVRGYKATPYIKYPHVQGRYILEAVMYISDTMDLLMHPPTDDAQERALSKLLERFSSTVNLDPVFLALELYRYRRSQGK